MSHLQSGGFPDRVLEGLARALAVKPSIAFWGELSSLYQTAKGAGELEGLAVALAACATESEVPDLMRLASLRRAESAILLLRPILRLGGAAGRSFIESLASDPLFSTQVAVLLRQRPRKAR
jgi:hypothetical protein